MNVFMYWENVPGSPKPEYLHKCFEQIKSKSKYDVILLDEHTIKDYVHDINEKAFDLDVLAHRADYFRAKILHEHGGIWLDADALILDDLSYVESDLNEYSYVGYGYKKNQPSIGFMGARAGDDMLGQWVEGQEKKITDGYQFKWAALGYDILWDISTSNTDMKIYDRELFAPIHSLHWKEFFSPTPMSSRITEDTKAIMFYNKNMYEPLKDLSIDEIKNKNDLFGEIFREYC
jgi:mannosyltransferase OCH1-like enzyme